MSTTGVLPETTLENVLPGANEVQVVLAAAARRVGAVLLYSPRSAELWAGRVEAAGLADMLTGTLAACLSDAVAAPLARLPLHSVRVARSRDQNALLRCLDGRW